ncbi:hypothetical protein AD428_16605 [Achromobacter sp. DMS1]|nr:hypothetical protein AD428_16605 [Achromobacter sp. DMS1]
MASAAGREAVRLGQGSAQVQVPHRPVQRAVGDAAAQAVAQVELGAEGHTVAGLVLAHVGGAVVVAQLLVLEVHAQGQVARLRAHERIAQARAGHLRRAARVQVAEVLARLVAGIAVADLAGQAGAAQRQAVAHVAEVEVFAGALCAHGDLVARQEGAVDGQAGVGAVLPGIAVVLVVQAHAAIDAVAALDLDREIARAEIRARTDGRRGRHARQVRQQQRGRAFQRRAFDDFAAAQRTQVVLRRGRQLRVGARRAPARSGLPALAGAARRHAGSGPAGRRGRRGSRFRGSSA